MPVATLIAANLVPLAGVLFAGWKVGDIVLLYWIENVIIGVMNVLRIAFAEPDALVRNPVPGKQPKPGELMLAKLFLIGFFIMHFGAFCAGHATFLAVLFPVKGPDGNSLEIGALLTSLHGKDVLIVLVESYGRIALEDGVGVLTSTLDAHVVEKSKRLVPWIR